MIPFMTGPLFRNLNSVQSNEKEKKKERKRKTRKENDIKIKHLR